MAEWEIYLSVLSKFLAASLIIERILEYLDKLFSFIGYASGNVGALIRLTRRQLSPAQEKKRVVNKMLLMQTTGIIGGVTICYFSRLGIARELGLLSQGATAWWDIVLSGVLISGGAEPIHSLINFVKGSKEKLKTERLQLEAQIITVDLPTVNQHTKSVGISYDGGLYPAKPGHGLRKIDPKYIVIHHSATRENKSFDEIVKIEQEVRSNIRGSYQLDPSFHCVITYDGRYHNYCRWDSVGWHVARGIQVSNSNALGLCFVGNFETRRVIEGHNDWDSNSRPSEGQIETGARIIALWRILYEIDEKGIVPHRLVKRGHTFCPGSNFPTDRLIAKSTQLVAQWQNDRQVMNEITRLKKQKYIYV